MPPSTRTYCVVLRDEHLDAEIPLYIDLDELDVFTTPPLSFELTNGMVLTEDQIRELIEVVAEVGFSGPGITRTARAVLELVRERLVLIDPQRTVAENIKEQERLGRIIAISSVFDDGVAIWADHWREVWSEANGFLGRGSAEEGDSHDAATQDKAGLELIVERLDGLTATVVDLAHGPRASAHK